MQERLLTHKVSAEEVDVTVNKIASRIQREGDKPYATVERQLSLLNELIKFDFGRYLLQHQGVNGYWTHYMLTHPWYGRKTGKNNRGEPFSNLEHFVLDNAPIMLATQQRFEIFLRENQKQVKDGAVLACIPSGMMGELLYLDYQGISDIKLVGIDYDAGALRDAKLLAEKQHLSRWVDLVQKDAWKLEVLNQFDLISSNGLNIYEAIDERVTELYRQFFMALRPGGKLVTSFVAPISDDNKSVNSEDLLLQRILFADILGAKWQCLRSPQLTESQLKAVGFVDVQFIYDESKLFPTVIAFKPA